MKLDEKALEAALHDYQEDAGRNAVKSGLEAAIRAYLSAVPSSPVSEMVERLRSWDHCWPAPWLENAVSEAASTLTTLSTRNAELEREVKRLREAVDLLETANSLRRNSMGDVNYDTFYDGPSVEELEDQAHALSTSPQGADYE